MLCVQVLILLFLNFVLSFVVFTNQDSLKKIFFSNIYAQSIIYLRNDK